MVQNVASVGVQNNANLMAQKNVKKKSAAKTGACVGAVLGAGSALPIVLQSKNISNAYKDKLAKSAKLKHISPKLAAAVSVVMATGILVGLNSAFCAGIGKIIDTVKNEKAEKIQQ